MSSLLTQDRLKEELRNFAKGALRTELKDLREKIVKDVREELGDFRAGSPVSAVSIMRTPADGGTAVKLQSKSGSPQPTTDLVSGPSTRTPTAEMMHLVRTMTKPADPLPRRGSQVADIDSDGGFNSDDDGGIMKSLRSYKVTETRADMPLKRRASELVISSSPNNVKSPTLQTPASPVAQLMRGWSSVSAGSNMVSNPKGSPAAAPSSTNHTKRNKKFLALSEGPIGICNDGWSSDENSDSKDSTGASSAKRNKNRRVHDCGDVSSSDSEKLESFKMDAQPGRRKVRSASDSARLPEGMVLDGAFPPAAPTEPEPPLPLSVPLSPRTKWPYAKDGDCSELPPKILDGIVPASPCKTLEKGDSFASSKGEPFGSKMEELYFQRDHRRKTTNRSMSEVHNSRTSTTSTEERASFFGRLEALVDNSYFNHFMAMMIIANLVMVGMQTDYLATEVTERSPKGFAVAEAFFCSAFLLELLLRLYVRRMSFFREDGWKWNVFDCGMVLLQLSEQGLEVIILTLGNGEGNSFSFGFLRALRILRVIRLLRAARIVEHVRELQTIILSIGGSIKSLLWTLCLLALLIFVVGVSFTQIVLNYRLSHPEVQQDSVFVVHYGSLGASVLTLYGSIMGGVDWVGVAEPLLSEIHPLCGIVFAFYVAFAVLAMMNVVTGVFVEASLKTAREHHDAFLLGHAGNLFVDADLDESGSVSWAEFESSLGHPQMIQFFKNIDVDITEAETVFHLLDFNECGKLELDQFMGGVLRLRGPAKAVDLAMLMHETRRMARRQAKQMSYLHRKLSDLTKVFCAGLEDQQIARKSSSILTRDSQRTAA